MFFARIGSSEVTILALIFAFVVVLTISQNRAKERKERLRAIEEALRSGNLEPHARDELVQELTGRPVPNSNAAPRADVAATWTKWVFGLGWLTLFVGGGICLMGGIYGDEDCLVAGVIVGMVAFGLVSLPVAVTELDRRREKHRA